MPKLATPMAIPDSAPEEAEPGLNALQQTDEDPFAEGSAEPEVVASVVMKEEPKPQPKPIVQRKAKPKGPIRVTENVTPPQAISQATPGYPESAKAQGIEGVVIVRYVVDESGSVTQVQAIRGPAELRAASEAAVRAWRFQPAVLDGQPVAVVRITRFPFRIRT
jgi:protein TonB